MRKWPAKARAVTQSYGNIKQMGTEERRDRATSASRVIDRYRQINVLSDRTIHSVNVPNLEGACGRLLAGVRAVLVGESILT